MVRVQAVRGEGCELTWTLLGADYLPVAPVEEFLEYGRQRGYSPNTAKAYARALALWWQYLDERGLDWQRVTVADLAGFSTWLRTGAPGSVLPLRPGSPRSSPATVRQRFAAVSSFYAYHDLVGDRLASRIYRRVFDGPRGYLPMLEHLERRSGRMRNMVAPRRERRSAPPVLAPEQMAAIKEACARVVDGMWEGSVRNRLLWALLEDSGMRLGEALGLRHRDWTTGVGDTPFLEVRPGSHPHLVRAKSGYRKLYVSDELDALYGEWVWQLADAGAADVVGNLDDAYVFVNMAAGERFAPWTPASVYSLLRRVRRRVARVVEPEWTPHWFRHTHVISRARVA